MAGCIESLMGHIQPNRRAQQLLLDAALTTIHDYHDRMMAGASAGELAPIKHQIWAFWLMIDQPKASVADIRGRVQHLSVSDQHAIVTRWAWMRFHYQHMNKKHRSKHPFECMLGEFHDWTTEDYEFYVLLHFLPYLNRAMLDRYLFDDKPAPTHMAPDFMVASDTRRLGVEITIAPEDDTYGRNWHYRSRFMAQLKQRYRHQDVDIVVIDINHWHACYIEYHAIELAIDLVAILHKCGQLQAQTFNIASTTIDVQLHASNIVITIDNRDKDASITLSITPNKPFNIGESKHVKAKTRMDKHHQIEQCCQSILGRIETKHLARFPKHTVLVIWPINRFNAINYRTVVNRLNRMNVATCFSAIWVFTPTRSYELVTRGLLD